MHSPDRTCPNCGSDRLERRSHVEKFSFESGGVSYPVSATFPFYVCRNCGEQFISDDGEEARHEAICHAMKRLTPTQIVELRNELSLSRKAFAELAGVGEASLARWESGAQIQSESNDNLLRLLVDDKNVQELARRAGLDVKRRRRYALSESFTAGASLGKSRGGVRDEQFSALMPDELSRTRMQSMSFRLWMN